MPAASKEMMMEVKTAEDWLLDKAGQGMEQESDRMSTAAIKAMIEHGMRREAHINEQCLAENARALIEENERLRANQRASAEALAKAYEEIARLKSPVWRLMEALPEFTCFYAVGLLDPLSVLSTENQLSEKLTARDATQQRAGAAAALRKLAAAQGSKGKVCTREWLVLEADAIERGEVQL
jgi:hypothetical protein